jgi:hypothetical protein
MPSDPKSFFAIVIDAGAVLSGFCGTFLSFRIQREANYYRQPVLDYKTRRSRDVFIGMTHFTSSFFLLILATLGSLMFGVLIPLFAVAGSTWALAQTKLVVAGLVSVIILLVAYFFDELVHYRIINTNLINDAHEWGKELAIVIVALVASVGCSVLILLAF